MLEEACEYSIFSFQGITEGYKRFPDRKDEICLKLGTVIGDS